MANNPYVNKVVYGNNTVMDISDTTAEESDVASGKTFYKASGAKGVGTAVTPDISNCYQSTDSQETDIQDADYFPFYDSSATAKRNTLWSNIKAKLKNYFDTLYATYLGVSGLIETTVGWATKNILNCDIASGTQTINGLTVNVSRTTGGDLIYVKVSGTATANTSIQVASSIYDTEYNELTGNKYILNGCPEGGSSSTYSLRISGNYGSGAVDTGSGALISSTVANAKVYIDIKNGYSASNLQFRPMIRSKYVTDATYEAYHNNVKDELAKKANTSSLATVATSGSYNDLTDKPTVDQTYSATSSNAQSGVAVASAISGKEDKSALKDLAYIAKDGVSSTKVLQGDGTWVTPSAGHTMIPTPATNLTESSIVSAINTALLEGGVNDDVPSNFGVGKWSNTMSKAFLVQGVAGSSTPVGTSGVGTWPADVTNPTSAEKADWICIPELYGCGSASGKKIDLVYDPATVSVPIARGGYVIDDNETMSDGQGGTINCAKVCLKFANEIPEADTHTAVVGVEVTIKRTETVFVG